MYVCVITCVYIIKIKMHTNIITYTHTYVCIYIYTHSCDFSEYTVTLLKRQI